ncbi:hypothetical protein HYR54_13890 [Candidatus Acetothermia bacterium]|nr:hypothetical protein [Candidatus Acetothermia bacterium]
MERSLLTLLREQARTRGLLDLHASLSASIVFTLVRDMPYRRASSRHPEAILREWKGTCSGKHHTLQALFDELGLETQLMLCTHEFTPESYSHFPKFLRDQLTAGPISDVHTFLRLKTATSWMNIDATWPSSSKSLGMPVNEKFELGKSMRIACEPIQFFEIPSEIDPQAFKEELIRKYCGAQAQRRDRFIEALSAWLSEAQQ